ncbi:FAM126B family protein [Megaselia abdita]
MAESIVQDWLAEYESLEASEIPTFISMQDNNPDITDAIHSIFNSRTKYPELIHSICNQLYKFYISKEDGLRKFTLQFIPILIYVYLNAVCVGDKNNCRSVETLLISMYNVEVSNDDGSEKVVSFRMPVLAQASIYHEEKCLNAFDLRRYEENCNRDIKWGPFPQMESINASNRMKVLTALLFFYNQQLCKLQKTALLHLCRVASQMVNQGFSSTTKTNVIPNGRDYKSPLLNDHRLSAKTIVPRIPMTSSFLLELAHAIYFAMFNDFGTVAIQTMEDIHQRGTFEMYTDLILVTNAVRNSLHQNPSGQPSDGPMGLSVALTPATNTAPTVSKSMITNASFRTKKLPDDIPIQDDDKHLTSISEEPDQQHQPQVGQRNTTIRSSKEGIKAQAQKALAGLKKSKDKEKDKESKNTPNKKDEGPPKPPSRKISTTSIVSSGGGVGGSMRPTILHENANGGEIVIPLQPLPNGKNTPHIDTNSSDFESSSFDANDSPNFSIEIQGSSIEPTHHIQSQV